MNQDNTVPASFEFHNYRFQSKCHVFPLELDKIETQRTNKNFELSFKRIVVICKSKDDILI